MHQTVKLCKVGGSNLLKCSLNSPQVLENLPLESFTRNGMNFSYSNDTISKLEIEWQNSFKFNIPSFSVNRVRKRIIFSNSSKTSLKFHKLSIFESTAKPKFK